MAVMTLASPEGDDPGTRLAALRRSAGLTQAKLAGHLGLTVPQVGRIEQGRRFADYGLAERWCAVCGGSAQDLSRVVAMVHAALPEVIAYGPESAQEAL